MLLGRFLVYMEDTSSAEGGGGARIGTRAPNWKPANVGLARACERRRPKYSVPEGTKVVQSLFVPCPTAPPAIAGLAGLFPRKLPA